MVHICYIIIVFFCKPFVNPEVSGVMKLDIEGHCEALISI